MHHPWSHLIINIMPLDLLGPLRSQMSTSADVPGDNRQIQTMLPRLSMATVTLYSHPAYFGLNRTS